jgi:hypothetical protein
MPTEIRRTRLTKPTSIPIVFDGKLAARLRADAKEWNTSIAEIVRTALDDWYQRRDSETTKS